MRQLRGATTVVLTSGLRIGVERTTIVSIDGNSTSTPFLLVSPEGANIIEKNRLYGGSLILDGNRIQVYNEDGVLYPDSPTVEEEYEGNYILTIDGLNLYEPTSELLVNRFRLLGPIEYLYFRRRN